MDGRRAVNSVAQNEVIHHTGDLTIEGDVLENSVINIKDGALTILGSVYDGVKINLTANQELLSSNVIAQMFASSGNMISIGSASFTSCNISQTINGIETMTGNVNNRIFTNDTVTTLGNNKYKVNPAGNNPFASFGVIIINGKRQMPPSPAGLARVTVDGVNYEGNEILIDGDKVLVDGKKNNSATSPKEEQKKPIKLIIHGNVGNVVTIDSDAPIEVKGSIGNFCNISSKHSEFTATHIGEETTVSVRNKITILTAGKHSTFKSMQYGIDAESLANNVTVDVRDAINISGDIGDGCVLTSKQYGLHARNIGRAVRITVRDAIKVRNIGAASILKSSNYGLSAINVGDNVKINVRDAIDVNSIGSECDITSSNYGINISEDIGNRTTIFVNDDITVMNVGSNCSLFSSQNKIKIRGNIGSNSVIRSKDLVTVKDVGNNTIISSTHDEVNVRDVGDSVTISARNDVIVDGTCAPSARLNSSKGKIIIKAPLQAPALAMQPDKPALMIKERLFATPAVVPPSQPAENDELQIPESYLCMITQEMMVKPVICILDGRTYEDAAIRQWFAKHKTSPANRAEIPDGKSINDILIVNRNLEEAIEEFRQTNARNLNKTTNKL